MSTNKQISESEDVNFIAIICYKGLPLHAKSFKYPLIVVFFFLCNLLQAQQIESVNLIQATDTLLQKSIHKSDSIVQTFQSKADSVNTVYQQQFTHIDNTRRSIRQKIDSLNQLNLPTDKIAYKLDSLNGVVNDKLASLTGKMDELKVKAASSLNELDLPPQLQEPLQKLQASINDYVPSSIITSTTGLPSLDMAGITTTQRPTLGNQFNLSNNFGNVNGSLGNLNEVAGQAGTYAKDAQNIVQGNLNEVKSIDKTIENKVMQMEGMDQLQEGTSMMKELPTDSAALAEKAQEMAKQELMEMAQDHFDGKQEVLKQAMDKISKLKSKYSEVSSLAELPEKQPNPLKGKPLIERLLPALTFQVQKSDLLLIDINSMLFYLITPRILVGAGWNERLPFDGWSINHEQRINGPRVAMEYKLSKGINLRLIPEIMNTLIPPVIAQLKGISDPAHRTWVPGLFAGVKKDFTVYKTIKGNTEVLYNLYDPDGMSPYGDRLSIRFGFEFPMKKK